MLTVDGDADAAVTVRICSGCFKFTSLASFIAAKDVSLLLWRKFMMHVYGVVCYMWDVASLSLSLCHGHFPGESGLAGVYWSKGWWRWWCWWLQLDYWSYKSCKAPFKSSLPTNQHPVFLQAGCPWSLKRKNELALHRIEMRMIRWCGVKIIDKLSCTELRQQAVRNSWHKVVQRNSFWWWRLGENVLFWKLIWESQTKT